MPWIPTTFTTALSASPPRRKDTKHAFSSVPARSVWPSTHSVSSSSSIGVSAFGPSHLHSRRR